VGIPTERENPGSKLVALSSFHSTVTKIRSASATSAATTVPWAISTPARIHVRNGTNAISP
jgi:hypothetical protein